MTRSVTLIICAALLTTACVQRRKPTIVRGPGPKTAVLSWQDIKAKGGTCASGTGGMSCTDHDGNHWMCPSNGGECTPID